MRALRAALLTGLVLGAVFPILYLFVLASAGPWPAPRLLPETLRFDRWSGWFDGSSGLGSSLWLSAVIALVVASTSTIAGFVTSRQIARSPRRRLWIVLAYVPFTVSPVILGVCLLFFYIKIGLVGTAAGVALAHTTIAYGFAVVFFHGIWSDEKNGLEEIAVTLGASPFDVYRRVLFPASRDLVMVCFFQTFLISWVQYGLTLMVGSGKVRTLPLRVFDFVFEADPHYAALAGTLLILPPLILLGVKRRVLLRVW